MVSAKDAFDEENVVATENALGALGKVIYFQKENNVVTDAMVNEFLSKLPMTHEEEEAKKSHMLFLQQVANGNTAIMNANTTQNVKEALMRLHSAVDTNKEMELLEEEGKTLLKQLMSQ